MKQEALEATLAEMYTMNNKNPDFYFQVKKSDMRSVLTRLRHMIVNGRITNFTKEGDDRILVIGYIPTP